MSNILFQAPNSFFDPSFWEELYKKKLHVYKLESSAQPILTFNTASNGKNNESFEFASSSFETVNESLQRCHSAGSLLNVNTIEEFRDCNKKDLLDKVGQEIFASISSGEAVADPSLLSKFVLLTFADLKTYKFMYWLGVPAVLPEAPFTFKSFRNLQDVDRQLSLSLYSNLMRSSLSDLQSIFAIKDGSLLTLAQAWPQRHDPSLYFVIPDASSTSESFGWTVRNFLALLSVHATEPTSVNVIGLRGTVARKLFSEKDFSPSSLAMFQSMTETELLSHDHSVCACISIDPSSFNSVLAGSSPLKVVGWESNERGKPGPRMADLSNTLDGRYLMAQAVDLNLSLMKWRMWPELDMARLSQTKCLLLGAGTLGCAVARSLLGWGVRDITLVDSGRVSYSNPARQCLFEYEDCVNKAYKATAAAERLMKIFPDVRARGVVLSIPMPGHPMQSYSGDGATTSYGDAVPKEDKDYYELKALIGEHEVIFALTDSREARWLPTAACAAGNKILINAALGFDSYLVMRHGHGFPETEDEEAEQSASASAAHRLGCYFCNDILAATNSMKDRTLDQMCTVTRPGLSFIAAALSVEMMVALLHSPRGIQLKAPSASAIGEDESEETQDSVIPHQIRGSLTGFTQFLPQTPAFTACTACSLPVVKAYREGDVRFVRAVCEDSKLLEEVSGAKQLMSDVNLDDCIESDDDF